MNITRVQIHPNKNPNARVRAWADIILDNEFIVKDLTIITGQDNIYHVNMPHKLLPDNRFRDIAHPINEPCRKYIENTVLGAYENYLNQQ